VPEDFQLPVQTPDPDRLPACPKCGNKKMVKQMSRFAMTKGLKATIEAPNPELKRNPINDTSIALTRRLARNRLQ